MEPVTIALGAAGVYLLIKGAQRARGTAKGGSGALPGAGELPGGAPSGPIIYDKSKYGIKDDKGGCYVPIITPSGALQPFYVANCPTTNANEIKVIGTGGVLYDVAEDEQGNVVVIQTGGGTLPIDEFLGIKIVLTPKELEALAIITNNRINNKPEMYFPFVKSFSPTVSFENLRVNSIMLAGVSNEQTNQLVLSFFKGLDINSNLDYSVGIDPISSGLPSLAIDFKPVLKSLWFEANKLGLLIPDYWNAKRGYLYKHLYTPLPNSTPINYPIKYQTIN